MPAARTQPRPPSHRQLLAAAMTCFAALLGVLFAAPAAQAETTSVRDPWADMTYYDWVLDEYDDTWDYGHDIARVSITHDKRVTAKVKFHDFRKYTYTDITVFLDTDNDRAGDFRFVVDEDGRAGLYRGKTGARRICKGALRSRVDHKKDVVVFSTKRSCLDRPRIVAARVESWAIDYDAPLCCSDYDVDETVWTDPARRG